MHRECLPELRTNQTSTTSIVPVQKAFSLFTRRSNHRPIHGFRLSAALDGSLQPSELLTDYFLKDLHARLYGHIWTWAGKWRTHDVNIGVAYPQIAVDLRSSLNTILYRWENADDWTPHELGVVAHAEMVRLYPFADGNGRTTRLLADLVYVAAQDSDPVLQYDWNVDKVSYINLLRRYDTNRDVTGLARLLKARPFG